METSEIREHFLASFEVDDYQMAAEAFDEWLTDHDRDHYKDAYDAGYEDGRHDAIEEYHENQW